MTSEDIEDIRRVLAICFRDGEALDALDIERILSFDMEWVNPSEDLCLAITWLTAITLRFIWKERETGSTIQAYKVRAELEQYIC